VIVINFMYIWGKYVVQNAIANSFELVKNNTALM